MELEVAHDNHVVEEEDTGGESGERDSGLWEAFDEQHKMDDICMIATLAERFGLTSFRPYQKEIINAAINGKDTIVIQATGSGKSLRYNFPAVYTGKLTLVITPTVSLMKDQTDQLNQSGISAVYLGSCQPDCTAEARVFAPNSDIKVVFTTPEWLFSSNKLLLVKKTSR